MNDIKMTIAKNITELRKVNNMTQLELAERLNYSDKAVSKWERGASIPDIAVLVEIADLFCVSLDYIVREDHDKLEPLTDAESELVKKAQRANRHTHLAILGISTQFIFFLAMIAAIVVDMCLPSSPYRWLAFLYAVPVASIVCLVFNSIWFNPRLNYLIISILMWSILASIHLSLLAFGLNFANLYLIGLPGEAIIICWSIVGRTSKKP